MLLTVRDKHRALAVELEEETATVAEAASAAVAQLRLRDLSYSQQYDLLFQGELDVKKVCSHSLSSLIPVVAGHCGAFRAGHCTAAACFKV